MWQKVITTSIAVLGFCVTVTIQVVRLAAKITTLENKAVEMDRTLADIVRKQLKETEQTQHVLQEHDKLLAVLNSQMVDIKSDLKTIDNKLDQLLFSRSRSQTENKK